MSADSDKGSGTGGAVTRAAAISALAKWLRIGVFPSRTLPESSPFASEIVMGVLRNLTALDFAFGRFCRRQPAPPARAALLVGTWQLLFGDDIPDYAAINETVEAAKRARAALPSFVNGVLRNVLRNREAILGELAAAPLHVRTSHPQEIVERWRKAFGDERATEICEAGLAVPTPTAFALPRDGLSAEEATAALATRWRAAGIDSPPEIGNGSLALPIPHGVRIADLPGYAEGEFIIQDKVAFATVADFLEPREGETILDCCAAPGGKTMQAAARVGGEGRVIALDNSEGRLARLRENLERTRLGDRVEVALCDAASPELVERFGGRRIDAVLVDTPCSNSGVFARRPEARWRWSAAEVARLAKVQRAILDNVARLGARRIVYSTCSIDPEENDAVAASFAEESAGRHVLLRSRTLLPSSDHDGAFAALLRRV